MTRAPCLDCFRTGQPVTAVDLAGADQQWPQFAAAATQAGFRSVEALPMRLRDQVIGALNLFRAGPGPLSPADLRIGQALADVATIGLLQERNVRRGETVAEQLQGALNSRVVIEQAKGKLAGACFRVDRRRLADHGHSRIGAVECTRTLVHGRRSTSRRWALAGRWPAGSGARPAV